MIRIQNLRHATLGLAFLTCLVSCAEDEFETQALTTNLGGLASMLIQTQTCSEMAPHIETWLNTREHVLAAQKETFLKTCLTREKKNMPCMSLHMMASAKVEMALAKCDATPELVLAVTRLNENAVAGVRLTKSE